MVIGGGGGERGVRIFTIKFIRLFKGFATVLSMIVELTSKQVTVGLHYYTCTECRGISDQKPQKAGFLTQQKR